jgi:LysM repeat protein
MTEPTPTGALACPFVAFEDDRDARADVPDHRHRCYAEIRPAPRAIAHQEAFCLSPGFAACPTFQDWARREAARAKPTIDQNELAGLARPGRGQEPASQPGPDDERSDAGHAASAGGFAVPPTARSRSRDWAAPPTWTAGPDGGPDDAEAPPFLAAGSGSGAGASADGASDPGGAAGYARGGRAADPAAEAAAGLAGSRWLNEARSAPADDPELADLDRSVEADRAARLAHEAGARRGASAEDEYEDDESVRPVASAVASPGRRANQVSRRAPSAGPGRPAWERSRRSEAYPTLKTRVGMPAIPRWVLALGALVIAAVVIFSLPFLLNLGGVPGVATPSQSVAPSDAGQSTAPSASTPAVPSQKLYTVVSGDTITKIAKRFGLTTTQLLAANPQIKNANSIKPGDKITIPSAAPSDEVTGASPAASPAPS